MSAGNKKEADGEMRRRDPLAVAVKELLRDREVSRVRSVLDEALQGFEGRGSSIVAPVLRPYLNTIAVHEEPDYPGNEELEEEITQLIRWNAMAMVVRANKRLEGIGGHISTYASIATLYEVGFHHFFRGADEGRPADMVYFQGHASPGNYARAFLEGRLSENQLVNFRRELARGGGLSSYPHPYLMPDFWQFPTVSMGLGPILSIYNARMNRYLKHRGLLEEEPRIWAFVGDGETDEPETLGALTMAGRQGLERLTWVVDCNLQRLDGPVRGNGKIIQELEGVFRGSGWNVIKLIHGAGWDELLERDEKGLIARRMNEVVDGHFQKYVVEPGSYMRDHFFGESDALRALVDHLSDNDLKSLAVERGGHDRRKVHAAYKAAVEHEGEPTVILANTVKGYGLGEAGAASNVTHQKKKLDERALREFRDRFNLPFSEADVGNAPFHRPAEDSEAMRYLLDRRERLGGFLPARSPAREELEIPDLSSFSKYMEKSDSPASTTMAFVRLLADLMRNKDFGKRIVPIIPDEARTFGMDALFRQAGIYAPSGQKYEPVDAGHMLFYNESQKGAILEEGITEAGALSSWIAAGTADANLGIRLVPFFLFYSMFGYQRVGDLLWAAGDSRARGFLVGATAGRTTLNGEGLQHQDGHSLLLASAHPSTVAYDPAFVYEVAVIVQDGLRRMYRDNENRIYYITAYNESYPMPAMPDDAHHGILKGMYRLSTTRVDSAKNEEAPRVQLFGSGTILREVMEASRLLADHFDVESDVWSVTSYSQLRRDALEAERWNRLHPDRDPRRSFVEETLDGIEGPFVAATDFVKDVPDQIARWIPGNWCSLGTDGFGRSDSRQALRAFFGVDAAHIAWASLHGLARDGKLNTAKLTDARETLGIDPDAAGPVIEH